MDAADAAASFTEKVDPQGTLDIAQATAFAIARKTPDGSRIEIVYSFPGLGDADAIAVIQKLEDSWQPIEDLDCWMPWDQLIDLQRGNPGPQMGSFRNRDHQVTLWVDQFAQDLFICFGDKPKTDAPAQPEQAQ